MSRGEKFNEGWTPVQRGEIYCSPRCGHGCTRAAYDRAVTEADELAKRMGDGWLPVIWENGGWHYKVIKGVATIRVHVDHRPGGPEATSYSAWIEPAYVENHAVQFIESAETPEDALGFATQAARGLVRRIEDGLAAVTA